MKSDKSLDKYLDKIAELEVELEETKKKLGSQSTDAVKGSNKIDTEKVKSLEAERDNLAKTIQKLKEDSANAFKNRVPKKPGELATKAQLKTMVNDLENEIGLNLLYPIDYNLLDYYVLYCYITL